VAACGDAQAEQVEKERAACPSASLYFLRLFYFSKKKKKKISILTGFGPQKCKNK
jgi:hypothetical protein